MLSLVTALVLTFNAVFYEAPQEPGDFGDKTQCSAPVSADADGDTISNPCDDAAPPDTVAPTY